MGLEEMRETLKQLDGDLKYAVGEDWVDAGFRSVREVLLAIVEHLEQEEQGKRKPGKILMPKGGRLSFPGSRK